MRRVGFIHMLIAIAALTMWASHAGAQQQVRMSVQQLFKSNHQIEVVAGAEVVWADPHFDRVWFPAGSGAPRVERVPKGSTRFSPGQAPTGARLRSWPVMGRAMFTS